MSYASVISGSLVASKVLKKVRIEVTKLRKGGICPKLAFILVGNDPASVVYVRQKKKACDAVGIRYLELSLKPSISTTQLVKKIEALNRNRGIHGILVQLPLPKHINTPLVIKAIDPYKDVDGFHAYNVGKLLLSKDFEYLAPSTPTGVIRLLEYYKIPVAGKEVVVIGRSNIVGKPLALMFVNRDATVTICHSKTKNLTAHTRAADIVCVATGSPGLLKGTMVKKGCTVVDVGFSRVNDQIFGDVHFASVAKKARWITPVPGGVGPMTVACLMENIVKAARRV